MIQTRLLKGKRLYACFVDLSQAFDTPNHNLLWTVLLKAGVSNKFVRVFQNIYSNAFAKVRAGAGKTDKIKISKGVLQGESASPAIFNLFLEGLTPLFSKCFLPGIKLNKKSVHFLFYADDLVIVAHSKEALQEKNQNCFQLLPQHASEGEHFENTSDDF